MTPLGRARGHAPGGQVRPPGAPRRGGRRPRLTRSRRGTITGRKSAAGPQRRSRPLGVPRRRDNEHRLVPKDSDTTGLPRRRLDSAVAVEARGRFLVKITKNNIGDVRRYSPSTPPPPLGSSLRLRKGGTAPSVATRPTRGPVPTPRHTVRHLSAPPPSAARAAKAPAGGRVTSRCRAASKISDDTRPGASGSIVGVVDGGAGDPLACSVRRAATGTGAATVSGVNQTSENRRLNVGSSGARASRRILEGVRMSLLARRPNRPSIIAQPDDERRALAEARAGVEVAGTASD